MSDIRVDWSLIGDRTEGDARRAPRVLNTYVHWGFEVESLDRDGNGNRRVIFKKKVHFPYPAVSIACVAFPRPVKEAA